MTTTTTTETETTMTQISLTEKEIAVLKGIANSDFMGDYGGVFAGPDFPVWSSSVTDAAEGIEASSMGGIVASLSNKGLVGGQNSGEEAIIWLTDAGLAAFQANS